MKKKILIPLLCAVLILGLVPFTACGGSNEVSFSYGDGATADLSVSLNEDGTVTLPEDPAREGYGFKGWYTQPDGEGERVTSGSRVEGGTTLYARWDEWVDMTGRNIIEIGGYNGITEEYTDRTTGQTVYAEEEDFALLAELGVDVIYMTYQPQYGAPEVYNQYLDWLDEYGVQAYIRDVELNEVLMRYVEDEIDLTDETAVAAAAAEIRPLVERYSSRPLFKGNFLIDEPQPAVISTYAACAQLYQLIFPEYYMYVNLLPNYGVQSDTGSDFAYRYYLTQFVTGFDVPYLEQDNYPIHTRTAGTEIVRYVQSTTYYSGLCLPATFARDNGRTYGNYIWTTKNLVSTENRNYAPSVSDLRFEAFNAMAFGAAHINLFCASTPPAQMGAGQGVIDNSQKTEGLWENTVQVLSEVRALSEVFPRYLWRDAACFRAGESTGYAADMAVTLTASYENWLTDLASDTDLLIGLFEEANTDGQAFMLVNNCEITSNASTTVTFRLPGAASVTAYVGTSVTTLTPDADGLYTLTLEPGQGGFVTVEK